MGVVSRNNVPEFENIELAKSKTLPPNLLSEKEFRFKNADNIFKLKSSMFSNRSGIICFNLCYLPWRTYQRKWDQKK